MACLLAHDSRPAVSNRRRETKAKALVMPSHFAEKDWSGSHSPMGRNLEVPFRLPSLSPLT
jgi:hypothetical protein